MPEKEDNFENELNLEVLATLNKLVEPVSKLSEDYWTNLGRNIKLEPAVLETIRKLALIIGK